MTVTLSELNNAKFKLSILEHRKSCILIDGDCYNEKQMSSSFTEV